MIMTVQRYMLVSVVVCRRL